MECGWKWRMPLSGLIIKSHIILHTFLLLISQLNAKNPAENSKEVSECDSTTNKMPSRKPESLLILEFHSSPHTLLLPVTAALGFIRAGNKTLLCQAIRIWGLIVVAASINCPDWYRELLQPSVYTGEKTNLTEGRACLRIQESRKAWYKSKESTSSEPFIIIPPLSSPAAPVGLAMFPTCHTYAVPLLLFCPFLLEFPSKLCLPNMD